jgi:exodeoxyribonuclease V alpha subunit
MEQILQAYKTLLKTYSYKDIIVISAFNVGACGTKVINQNIQAVYHYTKNHATSKRAKGECVNFGVGDKVMNTKNWYHAYTYEEYENDKDEGTSPTTIVNGDIGYVTNVEEGNIVIVQFDENLIVYKNDMLKNLSLAYSISGHKMQGSQAKAIIIVVSPEHSRLLSRELLYVVDTRAQEKVIEISNEETIENALRIVQTNNRQTFLKEELLK